jgi:hypothetical protein
MVVCDHERHDPAVVVEAVEALAVADSTTAEAALV